MKHQGGSSSAQSDARRGAMPAYAAALGLHANPFPVTPEETNYFFTPETEALFHELVHFVEMRRGFMLVTGEVGLGKTTLMRRVLASLDPARFNTALILASFLDQDELLEAVTRDFGLSVPPGSRRIDRLGTLNDFLLSESAQGKINVLLIDDAQALDARTLDVVRQLSNLETSDQKLVQVVLFAQSEIHQTLMQHGLRQVRSRIAFQRELQPLTRDQMLAYLTHRLAGAGHADAVKITAQGADALHLASAGSPRLLHHLMDRCLYGLMTRPGRDVDAPLVEAAVRDLGLTVARPVPAAPAPGVAPSPAVLPPTGRRRTLTPMHGLLAALALSMGSVFYLLAARSPSTSLPAPGSAVAGEGLAGSRLPAPAGWPGTLAALPGMPDLRWPEVADLAQARASLSKALGGSGWAVATLEGRGAAGCRTRPVWQVIDPRGSTWWFSIIEASWPQAPVEQGVRLPAVQRAQELLSAGGWLAPEGVDAVMGPRTSLAMTRFQSARGLTRTGQFDPDTSYWLSCELAGPATSSKEGGHA